MPASLSEMQTELIRSSFAAMMHHGDRLAQGIYRAMFEEAPDLEHMFREDMGAQQRELMDTFGLIVSRAHDLASIDGALLEMGARHASYGVVAEHYPVVRDIMLSTMDALLGEGWTNETEEAWTELLNVVSGFMLEGAERAGGQRRAA
ncbi:MAG: globin family protein [Phycisphaerales bacterium]